MDSDGGHSSLASQKSSLDGGTGIHDSDRERELLHRLKVRSA